MLFRTLLMTALLVPLAVPFAAAEGCPPAGEAATAVGPLYLAGASVYQESNGRAGLQSSAGSCEDDNGRLLSWAADTKLI